MGGIQGDGLGIRIDGLVVLLAAHMIVPGLLVLLGLSFITRGRRR